MASAKPTRRSSLDDATEKHLKNTKNAEKIIEKIEKKLEVGQGANISLLEIKEIKEIKIFGNMMHNRSSYSKTKILELAENIASEASKKNGILGTGLLQAIVVRKLEDGSYERIIGFRRIEAFLENQETHIPAIVLEDVDNATARYMRSSENLHREETNPYDDILAIVENLALLLNYDNIEDVKSFIYRVNNSQKNKDGKLNKEDANTYSLMSEAINKISKYTINTLAEKLGILNYREEVLEALMQNTLSYTASKLINSEKTKENRVFLINYYKTMSPTIKELKLKIASLKVKKTTPTPNSIESARISLSKLKQADYKALPENSRKEVDSIMKDIENKITFIQNIFKS